MKKAKIMLTAIAVLAVVGGALAFKSATFNKQKFCTAEVPGICQVGIELQSTTTDPGLGILTNATFTNDLNACAAADCQPTYLTVE